MNLSGRETQVPSTKQGSRSHPVFRRSYLEQDSGILCRTVVTSDVTRTPDLDPSDWISQTQKPSDFGIHYRNKSPSAPRTVTSLTGSLTQVFTIGPRTPIPRSDRDPTRTSTPDVSVRTYDPDILDRSIVPSGSRIQVSPVGTRLQVPPSGQRPQIPLQRTSEGRGRSTLPIEKNMT